MTLLYHQKLGWGIYDEKESSTFRPGEAIILYIEPSGFEYGTLIDDENNTMYIIDFAVHFLISDSEGNEILRDTSPVENVKSHSPNKEIYLTPTITQISPFPEDGYVITYTVDDENSGNSFKIIKEMTISDE